MSERFQELVGEAYGRGISDSRFQPAIKDLKEKIAKENSKSKVAEKQKSDVEKSPEKDEEMMIE